jgi:hypothetical protein
VPEATDSRVLSDATGYIPTAKDLEFVSIELDDYRACAVHHYPLGLSAEKYDLFVRELLVALTWDGVASADVRIQGSSARFFSSVHKPMPYTTGGIFTVLRDAAGKPPHAVEVKKIKDLIEIQWPSYPRPSQRPFDSFFTLGIDRYPSDIDIQLSSDDAVDALRIRLGLTKTDWLDVDTTNAHYKFIDKRLSQQLLYVHEWETNWQRVLKRGVSVALFSSSGPESVNGEPEEFSSHHKDSDWIIHSGRIEVLK